jgi:phage gpG-like protein
MPRSGILVDATAVLGRLGKVADQLGAKGLRELGRTADTALTAAARQSIASGISPSGRPWAARKGGQGWPPLRRTGALAGSVMARAFLRKSQRQLAVVTGVNAGNQRDAIKAGVAQFGRGQAGNKSGSRWRPMPPRPFVGLSKAAQALITAKGEQLLRRGVRG